MRHGNSYRKLGRVSAHRRALLRNLATSFLLHGKVDTTLPKAKELKSLVEKLITIARTGGLHSVRRVSQYLFDQNATKRLFSEIVGRYSDRPGGYTRIVRFGPRFGDGSEMCRLELLDYLEVEGKIAFQKKKDLFEKKQKESVDQSPPSALS